MTSNKLRKQLLSKPETQAVRKICLRLLSRREHSRREILNKVGAKGFAENVIDEVITELVREGLQSDQRFKQSFVRQRIESGFGPVRITYELRQCGIEVDGLDQFVAQSMGSWMAVIERVYSKKYPPENVLTAKEWAKRIRFLQQRGFNFEMIDKLNKHLNIEIQRT